MDSGIIIQVVLLIVGFVFLIKGSDIFVDDSSSIASLLKVPTIIVGLTICGIWNKCSRSSRFNNIFN